MPQPRGSPRGSSRIAVSGIVQGVGFRPFVYDLANRLGLVGFVRNQTGGVLIEVEGESEFSRSISRRAHVANPPPLATDRRRSLVSRVPKGDAQLSHRGKPKRSAADRSSSLPTSPLAMTA